MIIPEETPLGDSFRAYLDNPMERSGGWKVPSSSSNTKSRRTKQIPTANKEAGVEGEEKTSPKSLPQQQQQHKISLQRYRIQNNHENNQNQNHNQQEERRHWWENTTSSSTIFQTDDSLYHSKEKREIR